ncbi:hypothetical protein AK812_SmicGene12519 [Symbiodinium microadriaticum]|uniref:Uncharacterized protein n=1 Tax=Symbiodinium microadriaticum TaxID=2951 RepID=A0A1Q9EAJ0_SYMMI|nr:hypothetical protein AK812_SmicGene12519 [Symbiodinium microadriaticum]
MNSLDFESEESSPQQHEASGWRRLPTAWFHMLCVECIHIYLAVFAWFRLVANVNLRTAMGAHFHLQDHLEGYFYNLFLFGSTTSTSLHLSNVTDTFFLGQEQREQPTVFYNGSMLTLPSTSIDGANIPWIVLVWLLPLGAAFLIILHLVLLARRRVWSFDCGVFREHVHVNMRVRASARTLRQQRSQKVHFPVGGQKPKPRPGRPRAVGWRPQMASDPRMAGGEPGAPGRGQQSGHARPAFASGSRDLFPLPVPPEVQRMKAVSRRSSQKIALAVQHSRRCREAVMALNRLAGFSETSNSSFCPDDLQQEVLHRVSYLSGLCQDVGSLGKVPEPEAALKALLRGRTEYGSALPTSLATCSLERISLPEDVSDAPPVESLLDEETRRYLQCPKHMLMPDAQGASDFQPYWDPLLRRDYSLYKRLIRKLDKAGLLVYTDTPKSFCGIFFVKKSDGVRLRLIVDARGTNRLFKAPPGVDLLTSDGFARIELVPPPHLAPGSKEFTQFLEQQKIAIGLSDVKDCFHRMKQPRWLSDYFCFDPVPASLVNLAGTMMNGRRLSPDEMIYPAGASLAMGFTWSLFFAQRVSERLVSLAPSLSTSQLVNDRMGTVVLEPDEEAKVHHYVYVDNLGVISTDEKTTDTSLREIENIFTSHSLLLHPGEVSCGSTRALGCDLRADLLASRVTPERYHNLRQAIEGLLRRRKVSGRLVECIVGHATFVGLMCRPILSIFNTVYRYVHAHYWKPSVLWDSVREELTMFRGLMIYLHSEWVRPWSNYVSATDASLRGYGVVSSFWKVADVAAVGRELERSRFKKLGMHSARDSALTAAGFTKDEATQEWRAGWLTAAEYLNRTGWGLNETFKEVPGRLLSSEDWFPRERSLKPPVSVVPKAKANSRSSRLEVPEPTVSVKTRRERPTTVDLEAKLRTPRSRCSFDLSNHKALVEPKVTSKRSRERSVSASTSTTESEKQASAKRRSLTRRARRRARTVVDRALADEGQTYLETKAVATSTSRQYQDELNRFLKFAQPRGLSLTDATRTDELLLDYLNQLYLEGHQSYKADRLMAAFLHRYPEFGRLGSKKLPRTWRGLKGYRRLTPGRTRKAYPLAVWAAIATEMKRTGYLRMGLFLLMAVSSYARPSELLRAKACSLLRPAAGVTKTWSLLLSPEEENVKSKTGDFNVSLLLDSPWLVTWCEQPFSFLKSCHPTTPLWDFGYPEYAEVFRNVTARLGVDATPYQTRHSGPSIDRARNYRTLLEVQKRGQWKSYKSVARYEKSASLARSWEELSMNFRVHAELCEQNLGAILWGTAPAPAFVTTGT